MIKVLRTAVVAARKSLPDAIAYYLEGDVLTVGDVNRIIKELPPQGTVVAFRTVRMDRTPPATSKLSSKVPFVSAAKSAKASAMAAISYAHDTDIEPKYFAVYKATFTYIADTDMLVQLLRESKMGAKDFKIKRTRREAEYLVLGTPVVGTLVKVLPGSIIHDRDAWPKV